MKKAIVGVVAGLGLFVSSASAGEERAKEKPGAEVVVASEGAEPMRAERTVAAGEVVRAGEEREGKEAASPRESTASHEARWLREREGYRDGGY